MPFSQRLSAITRSFFSLPGWVIAWVFLILIPVNTAACAIVLVVINGISLVFDVYDSYRWLRGERGERGIARAPG